MTSKNFEDDSNYQALRDAYTTLEVEFDETTAPAKVVGLVLKAKDLLDDACRIYEDGDDADYTDEDSVPRNEPCTGEIWQHFKGGRYAIICVAVNATNGFGGKYVVYKEINKEFNAVTDDWYVRELGEFMSAVDARKYPDATQKWRFEKTLSDYSCWSTGGVGVLNDTNNPD